MGAPVEQTPWGVGCGDGSRSVSSPPAPTQLRTRRRATTSGPITPANAVVELVVDGDTIDVTIDGDTERVRLIGIDTPETKKPDTPVECFGPEATAFTQSLLTPGTPVRLERDVVGRDDYGRLLAYLYRASDSIFVNYEIIRHGYARPLTIRSQRRLRRSVRRGRPSRRTRRRRSLVELSG